MLSPLQKELGTGMPKPGSLASAAAAARAASAARLAPLAPPRAECLPPLDDAPELEEPLSHPGSACASRTGSANASSGSSPLGGRTGLAALLEKELRRTRPGGGDSPPSESRWPLRHLLQHEEQRLPDCSPSFPLQPSRAVSPFLPATPLTLDRTRSLSSMPPLEPEGVPCSFPSCRALETCMEFQVSRPVSSQALKSPTSSKRRLPPLPSDLDASLPRTPAASRRPSKARSLSKPSMGPEEWAMRVPLSAADSGGLRRELLKSPPAQVQRRGKTLSELEPRGGGNTPVTAFEPPPDSPRVTEMSSTGETKRSAPLSSMRRVMSVVTRLRRRRPDDSM